MDGAERQTQALTWTRVMRISGTKVRGWRDEQTPTPEQGTRLSSTFSLSPTDSGLSSLLTGGDFTVLKEAKRNMKRLLLLDLKIPAKKRVPESPGSVPHIPHRSDSPHAVLSALSRTSL